MARGRSNLVKLQIPSPALFSHGRDEACKTHVHTLYLPKSLRAKKHWTDNLRVTSVSFTHDKAEIMRCELLILSQRVLVDRQTAEAIRCPLSQDGRLQGFCHYVDVKYTNIFTAIIICFILKNDINNDKNKINYLHKEINNFQSQ